MNFRRTVGALLAALMLQTAIGPETRAQDLEARLRAVEDRIEIEQLLMRYAAAYNTGDANAYVAMFTPDAVFELRREIDQPPFIGPFKGREAIRKQWFPDVPTGASTAGGKFGAMRHVTTNYEINVKGDTATVRAFFIEVVSNGANTPPGSKPPTIHAMGRYEDELVRHEGRWLFSKRIVVTDLNTKWEPDPPATP
jgi:ketosteroid isomerase-like protein